MEEVAGQNSTVTPESRVVSPGPQQSSCLSHAKEENMLRSKVNQKKSDEHIRSEVTVDLF